MADKEKLSALMDGELIDSVLIQELEQDQESLQSWKNYHLIGDVLRGEAPASAEWNIAESVALALESEHRHTVQYTSNVVSLDDARVEHQPTPQKARIRLPAWFSQLGQVAVAASVSLVVIFGVQQYSGGDNNQASTEQLPVLQTVPFSGSAEPVSLTRDSMDKHSREANLQEQRRRVNAMLQDYELQLRLNSESARTPNDSIEPVVE